MTPLSWYPRPNPDTGLGFHDSANLGANPPGADNVAPGQPPHIQGYIAHARALRENGITWYKILEGGGNKVERCRVYLEHGVMPIVRLYQPRPHPDYTVYPGQVAQYVAAGVRYFEFGNEPNISPDEWAPGKWPSAADMGAIIARQWLAGADMIKREGGIPLMFAMTPGGTYDHAGGHRRITRDMLQYLKDHNALGSFDRAGVAIHPRPHNNPPDVPHSATNTVTWDEYRWYIATYREFLGWCPPMFATEHGYSIGDAQNTDYPRIDEHLWTDYNQELFERMNPNHPKRIEQEVFALLYWGETEMGTWHNDRVSDGWFPNGVRRWGQRLLDMNVNWNRTVADAPPVEPGPIVNRTDALIAILKRRGIPYVDLRGKLVKSTDPDFQFSPINTGAMPDIVIHHSEGPPDQSWESIARYHVKERPQPFAEIGYHLGVRLGAVAILGELDTQRAHTANYNHKAVGVCVLGNYMAAPPSAANLSALHNLILSLDELYSHRKKLAGHRERVATSCPGDAFFPLVPTLRTAPVPVPVPPPAPKYVIGPGVQVRMDKLGDTPRSNELYMEHGSMTVGAKYVYYWIKSTGDIVAVERVAA